MSLTVDASVFISAARPSELNYQTSDDFLSALRRFTGRLYNPSLLLTETVASVTRQAGTSALAPAMINQITRFPRMTLIALTQTRAAQAAQLAALCRLRGADAVYVAVAQEFGTTLITWDTEMLTRGSLAVPTMTPTDWLTANPTI